MTQPSILDSERFIAHPLAAAHRYVGFESDSGGRRYNPALASAASTAGAAAVAAREAAKNQLSNKRVPSANVRVRMVSAAEMWNRERAFVEKRAQALGLPIDAEYTGGINRAAAQQRPINTGPPTLFPTAAAVAAAAAARPSYIYSPAYGSSNTPQQAARYSDAIVASTRLSTGSDGGAAPTQQHHHDTVEEEEEQLHEHEQDSNGDIALQDANDSLPLTNGHAAAAENAHAHEHSHSHRRRGSHSPSHSRSHSPSHSRSHSPSSQQLARQPSIDEDAAAAHMQLAANDRNSNADAISSSHNVDSTLAHKRTEGRFVTSPLASSTSIGMDTSSTTASLIAPTTSTAAHGEASSSRPVIFHDYRSERSPEATVNEA